MSGKSARVVIVGAGHAGGSAAALLRQYGWQGPITLIGAEREPPYQRPPLSKTWLKGEGALADLLLVDGDPIANIKLIEDPGKNLLVIMKDGRIYKNALGN